MKRCCVTFRINTINKYWVGADSNLNEGGGIGRQKMQGADKTMIVNAEDPDDAILQIRTMAAIEYQNTESTEHEVEILSCEEEKEEVRGWTE